MLGGSLREVFSKPLGRIGAIIAKTGISPTIFSLLALVWAAIGAYFLYLTDYLLGLVFVIIASVWDCIDGSVARAQRKDSKFGNYLDAMLDKYVEIIIYFGLALGGFPIEAFLIISGSLVLSYAKPRTALVVKIDNRDWPAIGERPDRLLILILSLALAMIFPGAVLPVINLTLLSFMLYLLAIVVYIGGVQRMLFAKHIIEIGGTKHLSGGRPRN